MKPLYDKILLQPLEAPQEGELVNASLSFLPRGKVLDVGEGRLMSDNRVIPLRVKAGDTVYYDPNGVRNHGELKLVSENNVWLIEPETQQTSYS